MGETTQRHTHTLNVAQFDKIVDKLGEGFALIAAAMYPAPADIDPRPAPEQLAEPAPPAATLADLAEPWRFYGPSHGTLVEAYVDEQNQTRFVAVDQADRVPSTWRRLYVPRA